MKNRRIVIKIGSNVLTSADGSLNISIMQKLTEQIARLHKNASEVIIVTSGAVASGRSTVNLSHERLDAVSARQLFSAVGQVKLINHYSTLFAAHGIVCGQVLTTKESLSTREFYLNQRNCLEAMLNNGVIPIVNENDTISVTELMFTDNDELSGLVSTMINADTLIILSNVDGVYNGNPKAQSSKLITEITPANRNISAYVGKEKSSFGRGGMLTKGRIAAKVADEGIEVIIANGTRDNIIEQVLGGSKLCTRFKPADKNASGVKKWIAHSDGFAKGEIHIDAGTLRAITGERASSLLAVGVTAIHGNFMKNDIVRIISPDGISVGVGKVACGADAARKLIGKRGAKPLIHYDYLYLEQ